MKKILLFVFTAIMFLGTMKNSIAQPLCPSGLNHVSVNTVTSIFGNEMQWSIFGSNGQVFLSSSGYQNNGSYFNTECLPDGCYTVHLHDTFGDGWNGGSISITVDSVVMYSGTLSSGSDLMFALGINTSDCSSASIVYGCMDPNAANYNSAAIASDGSCLYAGCTDPSAINYNPNAGVLDSSCVYCNNGINAHLYICTFSNGNEVSLNIVDSNNVVVFTSPSLNNVAIYNTDICLDPTMCYTAIMTNNAGNQGWYNGYFWVNVGGVQVIHESLDASLSIEQDDFSVNGSCGNVITYGCNDPIATNYNVDADVNDGSCIYPVMGCTQINAMNYNANATYDDGSCILPNACGSMNMLYFDWSTSVFSFECALTMYNQDGSFAAYSSGNADSYACVNDGCYFTTLSDNFGDGWENTSLSIYLNGMSQVIATPYLSSGSSENIMIGVNTNSCVLEIEGCNDPTALNYSPAATLNDSTCVYSSDCNYGWTVIQAVTGFWADEMSFSIVNTNGEEMYVFEGDDNNNTQLDFVCLAPDCYTISMTDSWGDGWNGGYVYISNTQGNGDFYGSLSWGSAQESIYGFLSNCTSEVLGCTDSLALNYNSLATIDDGTCMFNDNNPQGENPGMVGFNGTVKVYPNPTQQYLNLGGQNMSLDNVQYHILSIDGKMIAEGNFNNGGQKQSIDVQALPSGIYVIQLISENYLENITFVKN